MPGVETSENTGVQFSSESKSMVGEKIELPGLVLIPVYSINLGIVDNIPELPELVAGYGTINISNFITMNGDGEVEVININQ